jgi:hypothetical protein
MAVFTLYEYRWHAWFSDQQYFLQLRVGNIVSCVVKSMAAVVNVLWSCIKASFYIYGFWLCSSEILCCTIPTAGIGALLLFILVNIGKLPPPDPATVEEILGRDPLLHERDDSKKDSEGGIYIMRSIAHRGAALDAPENSISAFRQVRPK